MMRLRTSPDMEGRYRDLVRHSFSTSTLSATLSLVRDLLESSGVRLVFNWEQEPARPRGLKLYPIPAGARDEVRRYLEKLNIELEERDASRDTSGPPPRPSHLSRMAEETEVFLVAQSHFPLGGETGVLRDVQSLLLLQSAHVLVPTLREAGLWSDANYVLRAMFAHVSQAWLDDMAHQRYLLHVFYDLIGQRPMAERFLRESVETTPAEAHDYLTKAQAYWSMLVEDGRLPEARTFALHTYRRGLDRDLEEIGSLVDASYDLSAARTATGAGPRRSQ